MNHAQLRYFWCRPPYSILKVRKPKTERFKKSLAYNSLTKWNALPSDLHQAEDKWEYKKLKQHNTQHSGHMGQNLSK